MARITASGTAFIISRTTEGGREKLAVGSYGWCVDGERGGGFIWFSSSATRFLSSSNSVMACSPEIREWHEGHDPLSLSFRPRHDWVNRAGLASRNDALGDLFLGLQRRH